MSVVTRVPEPNIWDEICKGFAKQRPPFDDEESIVTVEENYDSSQHNPVFFSSRSQMVANVETDVNPLTDFDSSSCHPSTVGYCFVQKPPKSPPPPPPTPPDRKTCAPKAFLDSYIFPVLLPALEEMLKAAKQEKCFERKRTKFNALDFLTEYLYNHNPKQEEREKVEFEKIPFVQEHWKEHPRNPLPKSLIWSEEEAMLKIQSFWRGYKVRREAEVQELRQWQKDWREENSNIKEKVDNFWSKKMPGEEGNTGDAATGTPQPRDSANTADILKVEEEGNFTDESNMTVNAELKSTGAVKTESDSSSVHPSTGSRPGTGSKGVIWAPTSNDETTQ